MKVMRVLIIAVCSCGVAGMIIGSIADNNVGAVITFGLITATAIVVLMAVTFATRASTPRSDDMGEEIERRIQSMIAAGMDEADVRALVGQAVRLGRGLEPSPTSGPTQTP